MTQTWPFGEMRPLSFDLIVSDFPWDFETYSEKGQKKGPRSQYDTVPVEAIPDIFPIDRLAAGDCLLLCWATFPLIDRQISVVKQFGFTFKTMLIWHKVFASGKTAMGPGYRARTMAEPVIVATMGNPKHKPFPGLFAGIRREHSRKPETFYDIVEAKAPNLFRRADLFARQSRAGWESFGDESHKFNEAAE